MIVVIVALENELSRLALPAGVELLHSGVGKVNAALAATEAILTRPPALVINFGTAGSIRPEVAGLVEVTRVIQRDMLAMPLAARGETPFDPSPGTLTSGHSGVVCATGDNFVTAPDPWLMGQGVDIVDMELFAIAHACRRYGVPWRSFKFITDAADDQAPRQWAERVEHGESLFTGKLKQISRTLESHR
jgi:adenosylhomocysteine nucleosidase